jgi:hypothetical protein
MRLSTVTRWLALGAPIVFVACAKIGPPQPPSLYLPKPPADLRAVRKGDTVTLTWTIPIATTDHQTIRTLGPTRICRSVAATITQCGSPVGEAPAQKVLRSDKQSTATYVDTLPADLESADPSSQITYAVEVLNTGGRGGGVSNVVHVPLLQTLPAPADFEAQVTAQGVVLTWTGAATPEQAGVRYVYRAYRELLGTQTWVAAGEVAAGEGALTLTDSTFEWEKTYDYRVEAVTLVARAGKPELQVEGSDSKQVRVFADDVFPPAVPTGLQAVYAGEGGQSFIDLIWAPVTDADLAGYNVYRSEDGGAAVKVNAELVKAPAFRDANVAAGKRYVYSVSAVDARGNESRKSEEAEERVP